MKTIGANGYILVTGAGGLLGGWVVSQLASLGYRVLATDVSDAVATFPAGVVSESGDIRDRKYLDELFGTYEVSSVVHCAGLLQFTCERQPLMAVDVNVQGTINVLASAQLYRVGRVVMMSTSAVYGNQTSSLSEAAMIGAPHGLVGVYSATKWLAERVGIALKESGAGPEFVAFRLGFVFGLGRPRSAGLSDVIQRIYGSLLRGETFHVSEASGHETWHFVHVLDVCESVVAALVSEQDPTGTYNVAGPPGMRMSLNTFIEEVSKAAGRPSKGTLTGRAASGPELDTRRLTECIGYEPRFTIERAVRYDQDRLQSQGG